MAGASNTRLSGADSCPCIDASAILSSIDRPCLFKNETTGNSSYGVISVTGVCYPETYGSRYCYNHDIGVDPSCGTTSNSDYCYDSWCYVDRKKCMLSEEVVSHSDYFPASDLFYSFSTCNSSASAYEDYITTLPLVNKTIRVTIAGSSYPHHFKLDSEGMVAPFAGSEYYNESIPFQGSFMDYMNSVLEVSKNIKGVEYVVKSKGSDKLFPHSSYTAAVNDVRAGLSDMALGSFWVTTERLQLTTFATPIHSDKNVLVVEKPRTDNSFGYKTAQLFKPFEPALWFVLLASIFVAAILGVWFTSPTAHQSLAWLKFRKVKWGKASCRRRVLLVFRLLMDGLLEKGTYFCNASVDLDPGASLPHKLLMTGFSFLILISVSAYVANLAAFLTLSGVDDSFIGTMKKAIELRVPICANSVIRNELETAWPKANFVFIDRGNDNAGLYPDIDYYDQGKCIALIVSSVDYYSDADFQNLLCERHLAYTEDTVLEIPIGFPINKDLAAGFSSYMIQHKDKGYNFFQFEDTYKDDAMCDVTVLLNSSVEQSDDDLQLTLGNMAFAFMFFGLFASAAVIIQLYMSFYDKNSPKRNTLENSRSVFGRTSQLWSHFNISDRFQSSNDAHEQKPIQTKKSNSRRKKVVFGKDLDSGEIDEPVKNDEIQFQDDESEFIGNVDNLKELASWHSTAHSQYEGNDNSNILGVEQDRFVPPSTPTQLNNCSFKDDQSYRELFEKTIIKFESTIDKFENAMIALQNIEEYSNNRKDNNSNKKNSNKEHQS